MNETIAALDTNTLILFLATIVGLSLILIVVLIMSNRGLNREVNAMAKAYLNMSRNSNDLIDSRLQENGAKVDARLMDMNARISSMAVENERKLEYMRQSMEQVYRSVGEMQSLAEGVGDLKKVLSNVKTRGILGEVQLGAILEEILSKEQYEEDIATVPGSRERVEFAVKLPGEGERSVYLPIDSKFPGDRYAQLRDAYESGSREAVEKCWKVLETTLKQEAKDIHEKYVAPPYTTDFAIMFLPFEGLYSEVVNRGMVETLQREYKVNIAGPTTMAALLSSLQMGVQTLAGQKHSSEVCQVLGAVKTEFDNFADSLDKARERVSQAGKELDYLMGTRSNVIRQKLKSVQSLSREDADRIFQNDREF
jgi:DNA recombination protein RmuC